MIAIKEVTDLQMTIVGLSVRRDEKTPRVDECGGQRSRPQDPFLDQLHQSG